MSVLPPPAAGTLSPDGRWLWDGRSWVAAPAASAVSVFGPAGQIRWLAMVGGAIAIAGEVVILVAYVLPFAIFDATGDMPATTQSIFNDGYVGGLWNVGGSALLVMLGVGAAIVVLVVKSPVAMALASGLLVAFGIHELTDWIGLAGNYAGLDHIHVGPGAFVGMAGAAILAAGGVTAALGLLPRQSPTA